MDCDYFWKGGRKKLNSGFVRKKEDRPLFSGTMSVYQAVYRS